jgi:hypothetical protein
MNIFSLNVGVIQFLNTGYSISLDSVSYQPDGVRLVGKVGNPKWINVGNLTLTFRVNKSYRDSREAFLRSWDWQKLKDSLQVASAQVSVGSLVAGTTAPFKVVLPNIKQTGQKYDFTVTFAGERYGYLGEQ